MNKHFIIDPNGQKHTRNSENRTYSHCVMVRDSYELALQRAARKSSEESDVRDYTYYAALVAGTHPHCKFDDAGRMITSAKAKLNGCTSVEEYVAQEREGRIRSVEGAKAIGKFDAYGVYGWCGRRDLAEKLAAKARSISHFDVVEVVEVERA